MYRLSYALSKDQSHFVGFAYTLIAYTQYQTGKLTLELTLQLQNAATFITLVIELFLHLIEGMIIFKTEARIKKEP